MLKVGEGIATQRIIGKYTKGKKGPLVMCTGGFHGNEKAGVKALQRVFYMLESKNVDFEGVFVGMAANMAALDQHVRFIHKDMNRIWHRDVIDRVRETAVDDLQVQEEKEMKLLLQVMEEHMDSNRDNCWYLDLHTTSAEGGVFSIPTDDEQAEAMALKLHVPMIKGLEDVVFGTALHYYHTLGIPAVAFEAGQHDDPDSIENQVEAVLLLLENIGCLHPDSIPSLPAYQKRLEGLAQGLPAKVKFLYRHNVEDGDGFKMEPGFENFDDIQEGQLLAHDHSGEIRAREDGKILMPLYQDKGEDGFFIVQEYY